MPTWVYIVSYVLKERWPKIHDESICQLKIARIQVILFGISRLHGENRAKLSWLSGWDVTCYRNNGHALSPWTATPDSRRPVYGLRFLYWRERRGRVCLWLLRYPQTGAGNCQAPARGRATISLTIGNGHQWQLRANNGFRFKFKYHVINCQRAWQRGFNSLQLHLTNFIKFLHR